MAPKAPDGQRIYIGDLVEQDEMKEFTYREDLDPDEEEPMRWPYFFTARDMDAVRNVLRPHREEPITAELREMTEAALEPPTHYRTATGKRAFVVQPPGTVLVRLTNGERHAVLALAWGIDGGLTFTPDMEGVRAHLASKHKLLKKRARKEAA